MKIMLAVLGVLCLAVAIGIGCHARDKKTEISDSVVVQTDTLSRDVIHRLTEDDYREVAEELGVEVAAIKAVVDIEAGRAHQGFFEPGKPLINFDLTMFRRYARKKGINLAKYNRSHAEVFSRPNAKRHGSTQAAQHVRLEKARQIDEVTALEGTFWGMFQIGGFAWKKCGVESIEQFVDLMSRSERDQLDLFAQFIKSMGIDKHLRTKNWAAFARVYNGPSYAKRGYHTKMANAYARHKKEEASASPIPADSINHPKKT